MAQPSSIPPPVQDIVDTASPSNNSSSLQTTPSVNIEQLLQFFLDPNHSKKNVEDVPQDMEGLKILMELGAWKSAIKLAIKCMINCKSPVEKLQYRLWAMVGRMEMRQYESAHSEFRDIGALDDQKNLYQSYPEYAPKTGSLVPLNMRLLYSLLPCYLPKKDSKLDSLYTLLAYSTRSNLELSQADLALLNHTAVATPSHSIHLCTDQVSMKSFTERVILTIASELCSTGEYIQAIQLMTTILQNHPSDCVLLSAMARIYLQMGNVSVANWIFAKIEGIVLEQFPDVEPTVTGLVDWDPLRKQAMILFYTNRGYQSLANGDFTKVLHWFSLVHLLDKNNAQAVNNQSLAYLYSGNLSLAIKCLEDFINADLEKNLRYEATVLNLCTLYDLSCNDSVSKKRSLLALAVPYLNDNFDISVFKIPDITVVAAANPIM